jgi:hypothetical protein
MTSTMRFDKWENSLGQPYGTVLQVVQGVKTDVFTASVDAGSRTTAAMSASITPTSATSKILILISAQVSSSTDGASVTLFRGGSVISNATGNSEGSRSRITSSNYTTPSSRGLGSIIISYLDSPATASSVTYDIRLSHASAIARTVSLNRSEFNDDNSADSRAISTITLMEIAQ